MADVTDTPWSELDLIDAATVQGRFANLVVGFNALPDYAIRQRSVRSVHTASIVAVDPTLTAADYSKSAVPGAPIEYTNVYPGHGLNTYAGTGAGGGAGWRGIAAGAQITFPTIDPLGMDEDGRTAGFLCRGNVELHRFYEDGAPGGSQNDSDRIVLTWMWKDAAGNWKNIDRCERAWDYFPDTFDNDGSAIQNRFERMDLCMATLIRPTDVDANGIQAIQLAIGLYSLRGLSLKASIRRYTVTAIPLHASLL